MEKPVTENENPNYCASLQYLPFIFDPCIDTVPRNSVTVARRRRPDATRVPCKSTATPELKLVDPSQIVGRLKKPKIAYRPKDAPKQLDRQSSDKLPSYMNSTESSEKKMRHFRHSFYTNRFTYLRPFKLPKYINPKTLSPPEPAVAGLVPTPGSTPRSSKTPSEVPKIRTGETTPLSIPQHMKSQEILDLMSEAESMRWKSGSTRSKTESLRSKPESESSQEGSWRSKKTIVRERRNVVPTRKTSSMIVLGTFSNLTHCVQPEVADSDIDFPLYRRNRRPTESSHIRQSR